MEMMRWSARGKLPVIHSSFNLFTFKYTSVGGGQSNKSYPSSVAAAGKMMLTNTAFSCSKPKPMLFQTRYLHVNPPNQGWLDQLGSHLKNKCMETVLFTKRTRLVVFPLYFDRLFNLIFRHCVPRNILLGALTKALHPESKHVLKIIPKTHPQSIRVMWILQDILDALGKCLYMNTKEDVKATTQQLLGWKWDKFYGWKWEIFVVDHPNVYSICLPGGIIFVYTGFLQHFDSDAEIAMLIGHQVAHIAARHIPERLTNKISYSMIKFISFLPNNLLSLVDITQLLGEFTLYPEVRELEADYIALMLIASAGYDPQIAPKVYEKLYQLSAHYPFCQKRINMLKHVMGQALNIHNQLEAAYWILPRRLGGLRLIKKV